MPSNQHTIHRTVGKFTETVQRYVNGGGAAVMLVIGNDCNIKDMSIAVE